jgi:hypothetical protein
LLAGPVAAQDGERSLPRKCQAEVHITVDGAVLHRGTPNEIARVALADYVEPVPDKPDARRTWRGIDLLRLAHEQDGVDRVHIESCWGRESRTWTLAELDQRGYGVYLVPSPRGMMRVMVSRPGANAVIATRGIRSVVFRTDSSE